MFPLVCPVCKNKFFSETDYFADNSALHSSCIRSEESTDRPEINRVRTSTPVAELESSPSDSLDSVSDFFYQSWKSGLHSNDNSANKRLLEHWDYRPQPNLQPLYYTPQIVYFNTVICQAFAQYSYMQPVGYRSDGTFGVLPTYWGYSGN